MPKKKAKNTLKISAKFSTASQPSKRLHVGSIETELDAVLNRVGDGVIVANDKSEIILFNPMAEQITGFKEKEALRKPIVEILKLQTEGHQETSISLDKVMTDQQTIETGNHLFLVKKDKSVIPITYSAAPINDNKSVAKGAVITLRDVSREYEVNRMKSEFVSIVSHQLRTPLSAIKWYIETLIENRRGEPCSERQKDYLEQAFQSNERMILLINDLLNVSRLEAGKVKNTPELIDLSPVFASVVKEMETFARANNVTIDCKFCDKKLPDVKVDPAKIRQVIQNLISNGIKYTRGKETLVIDAQLTDNDITFSIKDQGIGIAESELHRLFEPFFRAENAIATQAEGSGLGLYICKMLLDFNKGKIWVESEVGKGSTFFFTIPRATTASKK